MMLSEECVMQAIAASVFTGMAGRMRRFPGGFGELVTASLAEGASGAEGRLEPRLSHDSRDPVVASERLDAVDDDLPA